MPNVRRIWWLLTGMGEISIEIMYPDTEKMEGAGMKTITGRKIGNGKGGMLVGAMKKEQAD